MSLDEVAKRARVSPATVSRVLNNLDVVKGSTRARVMKAVLSMGKLDMVELQSAFEANEERKK